MGQRASQHRWQWTLVTVALALGTSTGSQAAAAQTTPGYHPWARPSAGPRTVDLGAPSQQSPEHEEQPAEGLPEGWVQQGSVVVPAGVASGELTVDPAAIFAVEDIPGNEYPRKHTVFLNFNGGMLYSGSDNSAENKSSLAKQGVYPAFTGGEAKAIAAANAFATDVAQFGIRVMYLERPSKTVPYTMVMIGGDWTDTNIEDPAGGVAPGTDCGALGQRHVVYTFAHGGWGATQIANVSSQEAGHAWGLDHSFNCNSVMAYCGSGDQYFSGTCDGICEEACQGQAGCNATHDMFCPPGANQQNEVAELTWIFGGNEPDIEPPTVIIEEPADGAVLPKGSNVNLRAVVDDNYGGYGWRFIIERDGEVLFDEVDYKRDVDAIYRAALNFVNLDPGTYVMTVQAEDHADHITSDSITITVEGEVAGTDSAGETTAGGETDSGPVADTDSGGADTNGSGDEDGGVTTGNASASGPTTATGGDTDGVAEDQDAVDRGCGCRQSPDTHSWGLGLLLLLGLGARRRPARG